MDNIKIKFSNIKTICCSFNSWNILKEYKTYVKWHSDFLTKSELVKYYALSDVKKVGYDTYFTRNKTEQKIPIYEGIVNQNKKV